MHSYDSWRSSANVEFLTKLCYLLEEHDGGESRWAEGRCGVELWQHCGHPISEPLLEAVRLGKDKTNLTECLASTYGLTPAVVAAAAPPKVRPRSYLIRTPSIPTEGPHARPERPAHLYPEMVHPALREKGRAMPQRTLDKQARVTHEITNDSKRSQARGIMVHFLLPKIHRQRKKVRREMARQKRMLDSLGFHLAREAEKKTSEASRKSWDSLGEPHSLLMEECPADNLKHSSALTGASGLAGVSTSMPHSPPTEAGGVRPPMGGAGGIVPPPQSKGSGAMGIIMPLYTVGIVVFFVYTIMKVLFKKGHDDDKTPKLKDFGLDPEYRKYVFAEEYLDNADASTRDQIRRQQREDSRTSRRKFQQEMHPGATDTKIG
ncbi:hypothetical protein E2C01_029139 [Portunus trituberculatus]|uniref:Resistance to inhibitors of cholinesterase protein 3 N-terminal domain-containing protein n=1 Tax=Portunus trituberculatus TaxID=210409 RepID=A0A5B7ER62_PORTR|nr:hypothetical protein [Portunus trituberculatus]